MPSRTKTPAIVWSGPDDLAGHLHPLADLTPYHRNPRVGNVAIIAASLAEHGQFRPVVVNRGTMTGRPNEILAGNHTREGAVENQWTHLAVTFLDVDDATAARIVAVDNRSSDLGTYDDRILADLLAEIAATPGSLSGTGYEPEDLDDLLASLDSDSDAVSLRQVAEYTRETVIPRYEIVGEEPEVHHLTDRTRMLALQRQIHETPDLPDDVREFLVAASYRHLVFDYRSIAEFYAHQEPEVQALMEASALVIIDVDDAIKNGYLTFTETIAGLLSAEIETEEEDLDD